MHTEKISFQGGLDTETPEMESISGRVRDSENLYQEVNGGYSTSPGYEAFSGLPAPSSAYYIVLPAIVNSTVNVGDLITNIDGNVYATIAGMDTELLILVDTFGVFKEYAPDIGSYLVDGTDSIIDGEADLQDGEPGEDGALYVNGEPVGVCIGLARTVGSADTPELDAIYKNMAEDIYRSRIEAVPGSGPIRGIWLFDDVWYAFRDNEAGNAGVMYSHSVTGWVPVDLGKELIFTSGSFEPLEDSTIVGATSGASAKIARVVLEDGNFLAGTAEGRFILKEQTGSFVAETLNLGSAINIADIAGNSRDIAFDLPAGRFDFDNSNFTGSTSTKRMYGVDGKNRGFEFDGSTFVPINTWMIPDAPDHVVEHTYSLFYSFGPSVQVSAIGFPYKFSPTAGGEDEIALGDDITGFVPQIGNDSGNALAIFTRNSFGVLYGTSKDDRVLVHQRKSKAGAIDWTPQILGNTFSLDDRGVTKLSTTQSYGNFADATVSQNIHSWLTTKKTQVVASCIVREKNQYWIFFADKTALCATIKNGEIAAFMPMRLAHQVSCVCSIEDSTGKEVIMFGCDDGFVRQMNKGLSFDGENIDWFADFTFDNFGSPTIKKKFHKLTVEAKGTGYSKFYSSYELSYGDANVIQPNETTKELTFAVGSWDNGNWDVGIWDGKTLTPSYFKLYGTGENISLKLSGSSDYCSQLKMSGALVQFKATREMR
jgi:hypothetical protein